MQKLSWEVIQARPCTVLYLYWQLCTAMPIGFCIFTRTYDAFPLQGEALYPHVSTATDAEAFGVYSSTAMYSNLFVLAADTFAKALTPSGWKT